MPTLCQSVAKLLAVLAVVVLLPAPARADRTEKTLELPSPPAAGLSKKITYQLTTPDKFTPGQVYPVLLVFPPFPQNAAAVNAVMSYFDPLCRQRGWVVVCPEAPSKREFLFQSGAQLIPPLLAEIRKTVRPEGNKFHVAGASDGGTSAIRFGLDHPELTHCVLAFPGALAEKSDLDRMGRLKNIPVRLFVGSDDVVEWTDAAKWIEDAGKKAGLNIELQVRQAQSHFIQDLTPEELFTMLDGFRKTDPTQYGPQGDIAHVLDAFHDAASRADAAAYFSLFAPEGVFIGTDAGERWTVEEFKAYAKPFFDKGKGWTYRPGLRHIDIVPGPVAGGPFGGSNCPEVAWFDEALENDKYGACRGTGLLRKVEGKWRICQYHLTVPVPNDLMDKVVKLIKTEPPKKKK